MAQYEPKEPRLWSQDPGDEVAKALAPFGVVETWPGRETERSEVYACPYCNQIIHQACKREHNMTHARDGFWKGCRRVGETNRKTAHVEELAKEPENLSGFVCFKEGSDMQAQGQSGTEYHSQFGDRRRAGS